MNNLWKEIYQEKKVTPQEAAALVKSGDTVYLGASSSVAYGLCEALGERADELENVTLVSTQVIYPVKIMSGENPKAFRVCTFFMGKQERTMQSKGLADFTSVHLSQVDIFLRETAPIDVAFLEVSAPNEEGFVSFGATNVALACHVLETARTVILQINRRVPFVFGECAQMAIADADVLIECDRDIAEYPNLPVDETIQRISDLILEQIPDGACLQLGVGGVSGAIGFRLKDKKDLGVHSEFLTDSMMELMKLGVINNSKKGFHKGKAVTAFAFGTKALYEYLNYNEDVEFMPFTVVNDPVNIAKNDNMISVNTAMSIDLFGQVCADNIAGHQYSAIGGQLDFVRGAQMSRGGKSFIAVTSVNESKKHGRSSRIVSRFPAGTAITTPRSDVQYVATEYGCVNLKPLTMRDRTLALISLAHPDFREQLRYEAEEFGLI